MELTLNGETREAHDRQTVQGMVDNLGLTDQAIAVEVNRQLIPRSQHHKTILHDGDQVEITTLVGGG